MKRILYPTAFTKTTAISQNPPKGACTQHSRSVKFACYDYMTERTVSTNRLIAFSDGVFAIAITILVLGISVPEASKEMVTQGVLSQKLLALWPKIVSYIFSFIIVGIFWVGHHIIFQYIKRADRNFFWLNILYLMVIAFIPFPAALLGQYGPQVSVVVLYGITIFMVGLLFEAMWLYATHKRRLIDDRLDQKRIKKATVIILLPTVLYFIAIFIALTNPYMSLAIYIIIPILYILPSPIDEYIEE